MLLKIFNIILYIIINFQKSSVLSLIYKYILHIPTPTPWEYNDSIL